MGSCDNSWFLDCAEHISACLPCVSSSQHHHLWHRLGCRANVVSPKPVLFVCRCLSSSRGAASAPYRVLFVSCALQQSGVRFSSRMKSATARECFHERPSSQGSGSPGIWLSLLVLLPSCLLLSRHSLLWSSLICGLSSSWCVWVSLYCSPPLLPLPAHLPGLQMPGPQASQ